MCACAQCETTRRAITLRMETRVASTSYRSRASSPSSTRSLRRASRPASAIPSWACGRERDHQSDADTQPRALPSISRQSPRLVASLFWRSSRARWNVAHDPTPFFASACYSLPLHATILVVPGRIACQGWSFDVYTLWNRSSILTILRRGAHSTSENQEEVLDACSTFCGIRCCDTRDGAPALGAAPCRTGSVRRQIVRPHGG